MACNVKIYQLLNMQVWFKSKWFLFCVGEHVNEDPDIRKLMKQFGGCYLDLPVTCSHLKNKLFKGSFCD